MSFYVMLRFVFSFLFVLMRNALVSEYTYIYFSWVVPIYIRTQNDKEIAIANVRAEIPAIFMR